MIPRSLKLGAGTLSLALSLSLTPIVFGQGLPIRDDFNTFPVDLGWARYAPMAELGVIPSWTIQNGGYRIHVQGGFRFPLHPLPRVGEGNVDGVRNTETTGVSADLLLARGGALRADGFYGDFFQAADIVRWEVLAKGNGWGLLNRAGSPTSLATTGYWMGYMQEQGVAGIIRLMDEIPTFMAFTHVRTLDPLKRYRMVATGTGTNLTMRLYEATDLLEPIAFARASDLFDPFAATSLTYALLNPRGNADLRNAGLLQDPPSADVPYSTVGFSGLMVANLDLYMPAEATFDQYHSTGNPLEAVAFPGTPQVTDLVPAPNAFFHPPADGIRFKTKTFSPLVQVDTSKVRMFLNGSNVTTDVVFTPNFTTAVDLNGDGYSAAYNKPLAANEVYEGIIIVTDASGNGTTNTWSFDTFNKTTSFTVEAEDYNYGSGNYKNNPAPSGRGGFGNLYKGNRNNAVNATGGYYGMSGATDIDYHDNQNGYPGNANMFGRGFNGLYRYYFDDAYGKNELTDQERARAFRPDAMGTTQEGPDAPREKFVQAGVTDYYIWLFRSGEWMNYTREFPAVGQDYHIYLRASSINNSHVGLHRVTGEANTQEQPLQYLGEFYIPNTGSQSRYRTIPLAGPTGEKMTIRLTGKETLRLTSFGSDNNLQLNYFILVPAPPATAAPARISNASPRAREINVAPDAAIDVSLVNGTTDIVKDSISMKLNGVDVTSQLVREDRTAIGQPLFLRLTPAAALKPSTWHSVSVSFTDSAGTTRSNGWSFETRRIPIITPAFKSSKASESAFAIKIHQIRSDVFMPNSSYRAERQLNDEKLDQNNELHPYDNMAAGANSGNYTESGAINYEQGQTSFGFFPNDKTFPGIPSSDANNIAMRASIHLQLSAGLHRWGVRSDDGFKVTSGPGDATTANALVVGAFEGDRGSQETQFEFFVEEAGVYPFRLVYYEGGGGADVEWYTVNRAGTRKLINGPEEPVRTVSGQFGSPLGSGRDRGFNIRMAKARNTASIDDFANRSDRAESQIAGEIIDPESGAPYVNEAAGPLGNGSFKETGTINFEQGGNPAGYFLFDRPFPGVDPALYGGDPNHLAMVATCFLELPAGRLVMGVRSDDGFILSMGGNPASGGSVLGSFEGGRGSDKTEFEFIVPTAGLYPFRLVWYEGAGGADVEWYSVSATGQRVLINDPNDPNALKAFQRDISNEIILLSPRQTPNGFEFSFQTVRGKTYIVEYTDSLEEPFWNELEQISGSGSLQTFRDLVDGEQRFYRARLQ